MSSWEKFLSVTFVYLYFNAVILLFLSCGKTTKNIKSNITQILNALTIVSVTFSQVQWLLENYFCSILKRGKCFKRQIASWSYYEKVDFAVSLNGCWKTQGI